MKIMEKQLVKEFDDIKEVNNIDGIRLTFNDGSWVLIRPSGTEDYIRVTLEAKTEDNAELIKQKCVSLIKNNL